MAANRLQDGPSGAAVGVLDHDEKSGNGTKPKPKALLITVQCVGISPLLCDPMTDEVLEGLITGVRPQIQKDRPFPDIAAEKIYRMDGDGPMGIPVDNLIGALKHAGRAVALKGKKNVSTATTTTLFSFASFPDMFLPFDGLDENGELAWKVDKRRGVMNNGGKSVAVGIIRPRFDSWGLTVRVVLNTAIAGEDTLRKLFDEAGVNAGLCSFRPNKGGQFGRFRVVDWNSEPYEM